MTTRAATLFIDVDTQHDFCDPTGALFVKSAPAAMPAVRELVRAASQKNIPIVGSVDSHAFDAWEFKANKKQGPHGEKGLFTSHCVKGTPGWLKVPGTLPERFRFVPFVPAEFASPALAERYVSDDVQALYVEKEVYSLFANPLAAHVLDAIRMRSGGAEAPDFVVFGVATDYCVKAAALGLVGWLRGRGGEPRQVTVVTDAIGAVDLGPTDGRDALEEMRAAGCTLKSSADVLAAL